METDTVEAEEVTESSAWSAAQGESVNLGTRTEVSETATGDLPFMDDVVDDTQAPDVEISPASELSHEEQKVEPTQSPSPPLDQDEPGTGLSVDELKHREPDRPELVDVSRKLGRDSVQVAGSDKISGTDYSPIAISGADNADLAEASKQLGEELAANTDLDWQSTPDPNQEAKTTILHKPASPSASSSRLSAQPGASPAASSSRLPAQPGTSPYASSSRLPAQPGTSPYAGSSRLPAQPGTSPYWSSTRLPAQPERSPSSSSSSIPAQPEASRSPAQRSQLPKAVPPLLRKTGTHAAAEPPGDESGTGGTGPAGSRKGRHSTTLTRIEFSESLLHQQEKIGSLQSPVEEIKKNISSQQDNVKFNISTVKDLIRTRPLVSSVGAASLLILILSCGALSQGLAKTCLQDGVAAFNAHKYQDAISSFDRAIMLKRDYVEALLDRGDSYSALADSDRAWSDYDNVLHIESTNARALEKRAAASLEMGKNEEAVSDYKQLLDLDQGKYKSAENLTNLGTAYFAMQEYGKALEQFNECLSTFPHEAATYLKRAMCYEGLQQFGKAAQDYDQVLKLDAGNVKALVSRARCFQEAHNFTDDLPYLQRAISLQPKNAAAYKYLGIHYARVQEPNQALAQFNKAIALNKTDAQSYLERSAILKAKGEVTKALADLTTMQSLPGFDETSAQHYLNLVKLHSSAGNFTAALADVNQLIAVDPEHKPAYLINRAECFAGMKAYAKALADCEEALKEKPNNADAIMSHGHYSVLAGQQNDSH